MAQRISPQAALAVYDAWTTPVANPRAHAQAKNELRASWPALGKALDALVSGLPAPLRKARPQASAVPEPETPDPFGKRAQALALRSFAKELRATANGSVGMAPVARLTALNIATDMDRKALIYEQQLKGNTRL